MKTLKDLENLKINNRLRLSMAREKLKEELLKHINPKAVKALYVKLENSEDILMLEGHDYPSLFTHFKLQDLVTNENIDLTNEEVKDALADIIEEHDFGYIDRDDYYNSCSKNEFLLTTSLGECDIISQALSYTKPPMYSTNLNNEWIESFNSKDILRAIKEHQEKTGVYNTILLSDHYGNLSFVKEIL